MERLKTLVKKTKEKVLFVVIDGLGGVDAGQGTELECARRETLDRLASEGACGKVWVVAPGFVPGSLTGHLSLFGYDPWSVSVSRGVVEVLGSGFSITREDLCARGNLCTMDASGIVVDRRAGRISTEEARIRLDAIQQKIPRIDSVKVHIIPGVEHRFSIVFRGPGLSGPVGDTDPGESLKPPLAPMASTAQSLLATEIVNRFVFQARDTLKSFSAGNAVILRGIDIYRPLPSFSEITGFMPVGIASYPVYLGLCRLMGFVAQPVSEGYELEELRRFYPMHDFFYLHFKQADKYGEDMNFEAKVKAIEEVDSALGRILSQLEFDLVVVTADHSTPSALGLHSCHPVPILFWGKSVGKDWVRHFTEKDCLLGTLGMLRGTDVMPIVLAFSGRMKKYGG